MSDWDYNDEHHKQARRTIGIVQQALAQNTRRLFVEGEQAQLWLGQLDNAVDELVDLVHERRLAVRVRIEARVIRDAVRAEIDRVHGLIQRSAPRPPFKFIEQTSSPKAKPQSEATQAVQPSEKTLKDKPKPKSTMSAKHAAQILIAMHEKQVTRAAIPLASLDRSQLMVRRAVVTKSLDLVTEMLDSPRLTPGLRNETQTVFQGLAKERREIDRLLTEGHTAKRDEWAARRARNSQARVEHTAKAPEPPVQHVPFVILGGDTPPSLPELQNYIRLFHRPDPGDVYDDSRLEFLYTFYPTKLYAGRDEFNRYYVLEFAHFHAAVFECPRVGNAVYLVELATWQLWARKSKSELWHDQSGSVRRILHQGEWQPRLRKALDSLRIRVLEKEPPARPIAPDALD